MTPFPVNDIQWVQNQIFFQSINLIKICNIHYIKYYKYKQKGNSHRGSIVLLIEFVMKIYASMTCVLDLKTSDTQVLRNRYYRFNSVGTKVYSFFGSERTNSAAYNILIVDGKYVIK